MSGARVERVVRATPALLWSLWEDVEAAPRWDTGVVWSRLGGEFAAGTRGELQLKSGLRAALQITGAECCQSYQNVLWLVPGLSVWFDHELRALPLGYTHVIHSAQVRGALGRSVRPLFERVLQAELSRSLANLCSLAESRHPGN